MTREYAQAKDDVMGWGYAQAEDDVMRMGYWKSTPCVDRAKRKT